MERSTRTADPQTPELDRDLIHACRLGHAGAWERLVDKYGRLLYSIPLSYGLASDDAADVTQIAFSILLQSLDGLRPDTNLAGWLTTVARRHTWRLLAHRRRESVSPHADVAENEALGGTIDHQEKSELMDWLNHGLNLLDERCRNLLLALYFDPEQPAYTDVAARLKMPVGSIGPTRARCLEQMKRHLLDRSRPAAGVGKGA